MPKRKRDTFDQSAGGDASKGAKQQRIQHKLSQNVLKIAHAFKIAKGFERQKLGRRQKSAIAEEKFEDVKRIGAEIGALKVWIFYERLGW